MLSGVFVIVAPEELAGSTPPRLQKKVKPQIVQKSSLSAHVIVRYMTLCLALNVEYLVKDGLWK